MPKKKKVVDSKDCLMSSDMTVRPEIIGLEALLMPFLQFVTTQRAVMFCSNIPQALIVDGVEFPRIFTGWENIIGKYEFDYQKRDDDVVITDTIPKFQINTGINPIRNTPEHTVICTANGEADYFQIKRYEQFNHFGYLYKWMNMHLLEPNNFVVKDTKFTTSPAHDGNKYMLGLNVNVCYMSLPGVAEDAFIISQGLVDRLGHYAMEKVECDIGVEDIPLNLYGDDETYRAFPDVGDIVNDDAVLMAIRKPKGIGYIADVSEQALSKIQHLHDNLIAAPPGAEILDIDVYIRRSALKKMSDTTVYSQFIKYYEQHNRFNERVIGIYEKLKEEGYTISPKLNSLVTRCMLFKAERTDKKLKLVNKKEPVDFIHVVITYGYKRKVNKAYKLTGQDGKNHL